MVVDTNLVCPAGIDLSRFPQNRVAELAAAFDYLTQAATLRAVLARIAASGRIVFVEYHRAHTKYLQHNPRNLRIQWNPQLGLRDCTGWITPALLLAHELGHAQFDEPERRAMLACERPQGFACERFGVEEARVIATVERPAAAELNAARRRRDLPPLETALRHQHQMGHMVDVAGPLSCDPRAS